MRAGMLNQRKRGRGEGSLGTLSSPGARWRGRGGQARLDGAGIELDELRPERRETVESTRFRPSRLAVLGVGGEGSTAVLVVVSERRGEAAIAGGDRSRRRRVRTFSGVLRKRERARGK